MGWLVLNLEGVQTRYDNPQEVLAEIIQAPDVEVTSLLQKVYSQPINEKLIGALRTAMGVCGAFDIQEMHRAEMVIAPAITTEGKSWQLSQS